MAILTLTISQNNKVGSSDLMAVHSPLIFLVDVEYSGTDPYFIYVDIYDIDDALLGTFKCIPYLDLLPTIRQFMFIADSVLRGYMDLFNDQIQTNNSFIHIPAITKVFKLVFRDPDGVATDAETTITAIHAASQFGENQNLSSIYLNETQEYLCGVNLPVYVYFYNDSELNTVMVEDQSFQESIALDYDDTEFADFDDRLFTINVIT